MSRIKGTGGSKPVKAATKPAAVATMNGCVTMRRRMPAATVIADCLPPPDIAIKAGATSFMTTTMLKADAPDYPMAHHQVIGQEALNIGMRHMLREGRTTDAFVAEVNAITPEQFRAIVKSRLARSKMFEVTFLPSR